MKQIILFMNEHVPPGATFDVVRRPQVTPLRPLRVRVLPTGSFDILDIKVGNKSQCKSSDVIPAEAFARHRLDHIEAIARWIEESHGHHPATNSIADAIRKGAWKSDDYRHEEDFVDFPCEIVQTAMDFIMVVKNRDLHRSGLFCAVWMLEEVVMNGGVVCLPNPPPDPTEVDVIVQRMQAAAKALKPHDSETLAAPSAAPSQKSPVEAITDASGVGWDPYGDE